MASRVEHIARFAVQDWRTSKVRARSARTQDPMLRTVYLEILFALYEAGGTLPSDPECLADILLLPADEVARCLPILYRLGDTGRGGIVLNGSSIRNLRVDEDLAAAAEFREKQRAKGIARQHKDGSHGSATAQPNSATAEPDEKVAQPIPKPLPEPKPLPSTEESCGETGEPSPPPEPPLLVFPCVGEPSEWGLSPGQRAEWQGLFPDMDIMAEARKALAWVRADPKRRKTAGGMRRYLVGWFGRAADKGNYSRRGDPAPNLQPRQNGTNLEQYRLEVMDKLNALRKDRGEAWYDGVCERLPKATTRAEMEALFP